MDATELETQPSANEQQPDQSVQGDEPAKTEQTPTVELSDEAKLAQDALALTDEPTGQKPEAEAEKTTALNNVIAALEKERSKLINSITGLRATLRERQEAEERSRPPEKSPLEKFTEENPDDPVPSSVMLAERDWQNKQNDIKSQKTKATSVSTKLERDIVKARERFTLFDDVLTGGQDLLTDGDRLDFKDAIEKGDDAAELMYKRCIYKTLMAGGNRAKVLREKLRQIANPDASVQKPKENKGGPEDKEVPAKAPESIEQVMKDPMTANVYACLGMEP